MKPVIVHHDRDTWVEGTVTHFRSYCGRHSFVNSEDPVSPQELKDDAARIDQAPKRHCKRCVKAKQKQDPIYFPVPL